MWGGDYLSGGGGRGGGFGSGWGGSEENGFYVMLFFR